MASETLTRFIVGLMLGFAIGVGFATCIFVVEGAQITRSQADVNGDGQVNVLDLFNVALCFGEVSEEPCQIPSSSPTNSATPSSTAPATSVTPTFTDTASPTITVPTSTSTPLATASSSPTATASASSTPTSAYTIDNLIADSTGTHDGCIPVPDSFDWKLHGRYGDQTRDPGDDQLTGWGVAENGCGESNRTVEIRNVRVYAFTGSSWQLAASSATWCVTSNVETSGAYSGIPCEQAWTIPANRAIHWATSRVAIPSGTVCMATFYEARGDALANAGSDWIDNGNVAGDHVVGRFIRLTGEWRRIASSGCTPAQLTANPPPF